MANLTYKCPNCGANEFQVPSKELKPADKLTCNKCSHVDTYQRIVIEPSKKFAVDEAKKAFKKFKGK